MDRKLLLLLLLTISFYSASGNHQLVAAAQELNTAAANAAAGDTIMLKNGTYTDAALKFHNENGTPAQPVVIAAEQPGKVRFEGNSNLLFSGKYLVITGFVWQNGGTGLGNKSVIEFRTGKDKTATYCTLANCVIDHYNNADKTTDNKWVYVYGHHNTITHCLLKDKDNKGPTLTVWLEPSMAAHHTISRNYFLGRQNGPNLDNGLESLRIGLGATSFTDAWCTVTENRFEDCDGEIETISNKSCHNSYTGNTFYNCDGGLTLRHGNNCLVQGNFFFSGKDKRSYGVRIIGEGHTVIFNYCYGLNGADDKFRAPLTLVEGFPNPELTGYFKVKNAVIANNSFINCGTPVIRTGAGKTGATEDADSCVFINNLVYNTTTATTGKLLDDIYSVQHATIKNNYFHLTNAGSLAGWMNTQLQPEQKDDLYYIPAAKLKGIADFLQTDTDAVGNKLNRSNPGVGAITGNTIQNGPHPLQPHEVGPVWFTTPNN